MVDGEVRHIKDGEGVRINVTPDMITLRPRKGAQLLEVDKKGAESLISFTGLPLSIARALSPGTFSSAITELMDRKKNYSIILKEGRVTGVIPYRYRVDINPERLLDTIEKTIHVSSYNRLLLLPHNVASLEIVGENTKPVARGDLVRAGVKVNFSPVGTVNPSVQSFAVVLSCTNGQTANTVLAEFTGDGNGEGDSVWQFFRQSIGKAYQSFDKVVEGWKKLEGEKIPAGDRATMLEALIRHAQIPPKVAEAVRAMAIEKPPQTAWQMQNLISYASSHLIAEPAKVIKAQKTVADFGDEEMHAKTCPLCSRSR